VIEHSFVTQLAFELQFDAVGVTRAAGVESRALFFEWMDSGYAADMSYLRRQPDARFDPQVLLPGARSIVAVGSNYRPAVPEQKAAAGPARVATYAWGEDYHRVLRRRLRRMRTALAARVPGLRGRICVDTAPFMDKYWGRQAGLGWQGKHTNLVSRDYGSWLVLGALIITAEVDHYDDPHADFCGTCTACLDACPTGAFPRPYVLDARRCISYWTIESRDDCFPADISRHLESWAFGCDICLDVCPWNKFERPRRLDEFARGEQVALVESGRVTGLSEREFRERFAGSAILRPGLPGLARNLSALGLKEDVAEGELPGS
jgi:epoxyqueuosine reductase